MESLLKHKLDARISEFKYFPGLANFILTDHLEHFVRAQIAYSQEEQIPLLKFFKDLTEDQFFEISINSSVDLLTAIAENELLDYIEKSVTNFKENLLPVLENESVLAEDITLVSLVRRKAFGKMLQVYTDDVELVLQTTAEIDLYLAQSEMRSFNAFIQIQENRLAKINRELVQKQEDLYAAEEIADMGSFVWDIKKKTSSFTPGVKKLFEMNKNGDLDHFLNHVHEEDKEKVKIAINDAYSNGGYYECEYRFANKGKIKYVWSRGQVEFDQDGYPEFMRGTVMNVTTQHQLIEKLQKSETLNKHVQAITHLGNWTWDIGEDQVDWSDEMYRIYGLAPQSEPITLNRFLDFVHPDDKEQRLLEIQESIKTLQAKDYLIRINTADGKTKVLSGKGEIITNHRNEAVKLLGSCQDITVEYNLAREVEEKERKLSKLIHDAPDGIIVFDDQGIITLCNPKCERLFGRNQVSITGANVTDLFPPRFRKPYQKLINELKKGDQPDFPNSTLELTAISPDQQEFTVSLTIASSAETDKPTFIAFLRDITSEKQTKEDLRQKSALLEKLNQSLAAKNIELEQINKELNSFNYIASHDLQEPIRKIKIFTTRVLECEESRISPTSLEDLNKVMESSNRMKMLITDLLTFSQASSTDDTRRAVDLNGVLDDVLISLSAMIEEKSASVAFSTLPTVWGIQFQMQQLFSNLISNSLKYCSPEVRPEVTLSWQEVNARDIPYPEAQSDKSYIHIVLKDNGIGFEPQYAEKIFDLFQRLHAKNEYSGTGIGLAICKKIVLNHHGFIKAESSLGKGATFHIYFPDLNID